MDTTIKPVQFKVRNWRTGAVQFIAELNCGPTEMESVKWALAVKWAIKTGADLSGTDLSSANLGGADLSSANLSSADLSGADLSSANLSGSNLSCAYLSGSNLRGANLRGAELRGVDLSGVDLSGANLRGSNLRGADLSGSNLRGAYLGNQWIIQGATRSDGYVFFLQQLQRDKEPMVKAGCRYFTMAQAQAHWETTRKGQQLLDETREIVSCMFNLARVRGFIK